jgi:hypothetical protein
VKSKGWLGWPACAAILVAGSLVRLPQLGHALTGDHAFRQTQTAFAIREYAAHGVSLLHSPLPVFGRADDLPLEFPLFQAMARQLMHFGFDDSTAGRLAGLIAFQATGLLWWVLLRRWHGPALAVTTLVMFEILPFGLHWGAASLIDFLSVALGLLMVVGFDLWLSGTAARRWPALLLCAIGGAGVFLVKLTTVPAGCALLVLSAVLALESVGWSRLWRRAFAGLVAGPALGLVLLLMWTRHSDRIKTRTVVTDFMASENQWARNFGGSRLSGVGWQLIAARTAGEIAGLGCLALVVGVLLGLVRASSRTRILTGGIVLSAAAPVLVFFNLYAIHSYYLIAVYPALTALGALGLVRLCELAPARTALYLLAPAALCLAWLVTAALSPLGRHDVRDLLDETSAPHEVGALTSVTPDDARIVTVGCDWDSQYLYLAHREGLMLRDLPPREIAAIWSEDDVSDYDFVLRCDADEPLEDYFPTGTTWTGTARPEVFALHRATGR